MDCANVTKIPTPHLPNAVSPLMSMRCTIKDNFTTGNGKLSKVIADIAQCDGNVFFVFREHQIYMHKMRIAYLQ